MSIIYMDGFDHYGTSTAALTSGLWTSTSSSTSIGIPTWGAARTGTYALSDSYGSYSQLTLPDTLDTVTFSMGFAANKYLTSDRELAICQFNGSTAKLSASMNGNGAVYFTRTVGSTATVIGTSNPGLMTAQRWYFVQVVISDTTASIYIDNTDGTDDPVLTVTYSSLGTGNTLGLMASESGSGTHMSGWIDDLIVYNTDAHDIGDRRVALLTPNADTESYDTWTAFYDKKFGAGIGRYAYLLPSNSTVQNTSATAYTAKATALDIGSNDFTYETFIKFHVLPTTTSYATLFGRWDATNNARAFRLIYGGPSFNSSSLQFDISTDGTSGTAVSKIVYPWSPNLNQWYHIALDRVNGELLLFVDGEQLGLPIDSPETYYTGGTSRTALGNEMTGTSVVSGTYFVGNMDESRFTNGVGRYTTAFNVPTEAFPRGSDDPYWSSVVWLMGYNTGITDESSYVRTVTTIGNATSYTVNDGSDLGQYSSIGETAPNDHNGIVASLIASTNVLTMTTQPDDGDTVTVGTVDDDTDAVYTFKTTVVDAYDVLIDDTAQNTLLNFMNAVNLGSGIGTKYGTGTLVNIDVTMSQLPEGQLQATANIAGADGDSIESTSTGSAASWETSTLTGGQDIPTATRFKFSRPPLKTTIIDAIQLVTRASKSDSGTGKFQAGLVGKGGGVVTGTERTLGISSNYYNDIIVTDPDSGGDITPTTLISGFYQVNRTA